MIYWFWYTHSSFLLLSFAGMGIQAFEKKESKCGHFLLDLQKLVKRTSKCFESCNTLCPKELFNLTFISFFKVTVSCRHRMKTNMFYRLNCFGLYLTIWEDIFSETL